MNEQMNAVERFAEQYEQIRTEIGKEMIGQAEVVEHLLLAVIAGGNVLLDLMPADITGTNILVRTEEGNAFRFQKGPLFSSIVLADEINRATPKTQAALLEAMQEHSVTVAGETRQLPEPYFVLATQNPVEQEGTYPLPEAQLDRFMFKVIVPFPSKEELKGIVNLTEGSRPPVIEKRIDGRGLLHARELVNQIPIADAVMDYLLNIVMGTHEPNPYIKEGASPRAAQALIRGAKASAFLEGRFNVSFQDVERMAYPVLRHRILLSFDAVSEGVTEDGVIAKILAAKRA